jgi:hypothetical protein
VKVDICLDINPSLFRDQRLLLCYLEPHDKSGAITGLMNLCDEIADYMADVYGEERQLLTGDAAEDAEGKRLVRDILDSDVEETTNAND